MTPERAQGLAAAELERGGAAYEAETSTEAVLMLVGRKERTRGLAGLNRSQST